MLYHQLGPDITQAQTHIGGPDSIHFSVPHTGAPQGCVVSPLFYYIYLFFFNAAKTTLMKPSCYIITVLVEHVHGRCLDISGPPHWISPPTHNWHIVACLTISLCNREVALLTSPFILPIYSSCFQTEFQSRQRNSDIPYLQTFRSSYFMFSVWTPKYCKNEVFTADSLSRNVKQHYVSLAVVSKGGFDLRLHNWKCIMTPISIWAAYVL